MRAWLLVVLVLFCFAIALLPAQSSRAEYIVVLKSGKSIGAVNKAHGTQTVRQVPNTPIYLVSGDNGGQDVLKRLTEDKDIDTAEGNPKVTLASADPARLDASLVQQMASLLDGSTLTTFYGTTVLQAYVDQPAVRITRLTDARSLSTGAATRVAYIDTGVDFSHPALRAWLDPGVDLVFNQTGSELDGLSQQMASLLDQQRESFLDSRFSSILNQAMASLLDGGGVSETFPSALGHGTLVAGIIHLFAPEARIVPIRAFDAYGNTTMFRLVEAVYAARDLNVDVLNMSFSLNADSDVLYKALSAAKASGIALVASAGNDASDAMNLYPGAYPQVVGVTATDGADRLASFSNYGKSVSIAAPGAYVVSTVPGGRYAAAWGTSFSAPIVSGTIALVSSTHGHGQSDSQMVLTTADFIDDLNPGFEKKLGKGRINVQRSLKGDK